MHGNAHIRKSLLLKSKHKKKKAETLFIYQGLPSQGYASAVAWWAIEEAFVANDVFELCQATDFISSWSWVRKIWPTISSRSCPDLKGTRCQPSPSTFCYSLCKRATLKDFHAGKDWAVINSGMTEMHDAITTDDASGGLGGAGDGQRFDVRYPRPKESDITDLPNRNWNIPCVRTFTQHAGNTSVVSHSMTPMISPSGSSRPWSSAQEHQERHGSARSSPADPWYWWRYITQEILTFNYR